MGSLLPSISLWSWAVQWEGASVNEETQLMDGPEKSLRLSSSLFSSGGAGVWMMGCLPLCALRSPGQAQEEGGLQALGWGQLSAGGACYGAHL